MSDKSCYIVAHDGYKSQLWDVDKLPKCFDVSDRAIVIEHNRALGAAWARMHKDIRVITDINDGLCRDLTEARKAKQLLEEKIRRMSDTIRRQGEQIKGSEGMV